MIASGAIRRAGGVPIEFNTIGICDGVAMGHTGMKYSLASREIIADSVEVMAEAHGFDALVMVTNCDKITPGMIMASARLDIPTVIVSGGPMLSGQGCGKTLDLISVFGAVPQAVAGLDMDRIPWAWYGLSIASRGPTGRRRRALCGIRFWSETTIPLSEL